MIGDGSAPGTPAAGFLRSDEQMGPFVKLMCFMTGLFLRGRPRGTGTSISRYFIVFNRFRAERFTEIRLSP
jgi:hypothetical protein